MLPPPFPGAVVRVILKPLPAREHFAAAAAAQGGEVGAGRRVPRAVVARAFPPARHAASLASHTTRAASTRFRTPIRLYAPFKCDNTVSGAIPVTEAISRFVNPSAAATTHLSCAAVSVAGGW